MGADPCTSVASGSHAVQRARRHDAQRVRRRGFTCITIALLGHAPLRHSGRRLTLVQCCWPRVKSPLHCRLRPALQSVRWAISIAHKNYCAPCPGSFLAALAVLVVMVTALTGPARAARGGASKDAPFDRDMCVRCRLRALTWPPPRLFHALAPSILDGAQR